MAAKNNPLDDKFNDSMYIGELQQIKSLKSTFLCCVKPLE